MKNKWLVIGLSILFIALTILIKLELVTGFDTSIYHLIASNITDTKTLIYKIITFFGSTLFIVILCVFFVALFWFLKKKNYGLVIAGVLIISTIVNNLIKVIVMRARPDVLALVSESTYSFPSGHTMASVSLYGILLYLIIKSKMAKNLKIPLSIFLGILPLLIGISRIYLGAHFATDIIGGMIMSTILLLIETYYIEKKEWLV